jgi:hypothetical protein
MPTGKVFDLVIAPVFLYTTIEFINWQKVCYLCKNVFTYVHPEKYRKIAKTDEIV